jgi:uncharacterized protein (TIGR00369 family)
MSQITHQDFLNLILQSKSKMGEKAQSILLPPPSMITLKNSYTHFMPGVSLTAEVPFNDEFRNPVGFFQGGMLAAALDDVFGPLSYLTAENPCVTLDYNIKFMRPFTKQDQKAVMNVTVLAKTKSLITMEAKVTNPEGKLLASASMTSMILKD